MTSYTPRYDRIASLVLVVVLGLAVVLLVDVNPNILRAHLGGDLPTITVSWVLIALLVVITSTGADLLARDHPAMQTRTLPTLNLRFIKVELVPGFWILPSFTVVSSFAFFRLFRGSVQGVAFVLALVAVGGLLLVVLASQLYALNREQQTRQRAQLVLQLVTYALAFGCFSAVYYTRFRTLYAATLIGGTGLLLAYEVLQWTRQRHGLLLSVIVGLLLAEATWPLNYWSAHFLIGGVFLLILFYIAVSLLWHQRMQTLHRNVLIEYGLLGGGLLAVVIFLTFQNSG